MEKLPKKLFFMMALFFLTKGAWAEKSGNASAHLENLGFTLLQATPVDFELENVKAGRSKLKDFRGKWIFLAFWATWCGPCNEELPQLEVLYKKLKKDGLAVVGVSVDQDRASVETFRKDKAISFPLLWDSDSRVASKYQASALPTLYAISPDYKLVGVLRGARDWVSAEATADVAAVLGIKDYQDNSGIKMVQEDGALTLPNNLSPPVLSLDVPTQVVEKGKELALTVAVEWKGNPKEYLIKVPKLTLPEGVSQGEISSSSTSENETTRLQYHFPLTLSKEGSVKLGPVELAYSPRSGGKELFSRHEGITIEVDKKSWANLAALLVGAILAVVLAGVAIWWRRKGPAAAKKAPRNWSGSYDEIRQLKMRGQKQEYIAALLALSLELDQELGTPNPGTRTLLEQIRFGGSAPSETELMNFEKRVELAVRNQASKVEE